MKSIKNGLVEKVEQAFTDSYNKYKGIIKGPEGSKGFTPWPNEKRLSIHETNQVANFLFAYKTLNENCITWHELSIPYKDGNKNKTNHVDGFIIDGNKVVFIEAKRFSRVNNKQEELKEDLKNIIELPDDARKRFKKRLPDCPEKEYEFYCLLLADYWKYRNMITKKLLPEPINWDTTVDGYTKVDKVI